MVSTFAKFVCVESVRFEKKNLSLYRVRVENSVKCDKKLQTLVINTEIV